MDAAKSHATQPQNARVGRSRFDGAGDAHRHTGVYVGVDRLGLVARAIDRLGVPGLRLVALGGFGGALFLWAVFWAGFVAADSTIDQRGGKSIEREQRAQQYLKREFGDGV